MIAHWRSYPVCTSCRIQLWSLDWTLHSNQVFDKPSQAGKQPKFPWLRRNIWDFVEARVEASESPQNKTTEVHGLMSRLWMVMLWNVGRYAERLSILAGVWRYCRPFSTTWCHLVQGSNLPNPLRMFSFSSNEANSWQVFGKYHWQT